MKTSDLLRSAMDSAGLTVSEWARLSGLPASTMSRYITGAQEPSASRFLRLLRIAGESSVSTGLTEDPVWIDSRSFVAERLSGLPESIIARDTRAEYVRRLRDAA